ncbi:MAG TPA: hypothetical protein VM121_04515, partial [Acidimicrobiales bacterium]|nr:hypothetical protein [Acidimicrobiales bacterium]
MLRRDLSDETATALMNALPPLDWTDVARRSDIESLRAAFKVDRAELNGEFAGLRGEFAELKGEFAELTGEFADLKGEF